MLPLLVLPHRVKAIAPHIAQQERKKTGPQPEMWSGKLRDFSAVAAPSSHPPPSQLTLIGNGRAGIHRNTAASQARGHKTTAEEDFGAVQTDVGGIYCFTKTPQWFTSAI